MYSRVTSMWDNSQSHIHIRYEWEDDKIVDQIFSRATIKDYFFNENGDTWENQVLERVKEIVSSNDIFKEILQRNLEEVNIKEKFEKKEIVQIHVYPEDFGKKDFRNH